MGLTKEDVAAKIILAPVPEADKELENSHRLLATQDKFAYNLQPES